MTSAVDCCEVNVAPVGDRPDLSQEPAIFIPAAISEELTIAFIAGGSATRPLVWWKLAMVWYAWGDIAGVAGTSARSRGMMAATVAGVRAGRQSFKSAPSLA